MLSSSLKSFQFAVADDSALISIADSSGEVFFLTTLYPYGGKVTIYCLDLLLVQRMRDKDISRDTFRIKCNDSVRELVVTNCQELNVVEPDVNDFLTTCRTRLIRQDTPICFSRFKESDGSVFIDMRQNCTDGSVLNASASFANLTFEHSMSLEELLTAAKEFNDAITEISSFTISSGADAIHFRVLPADVQGINFVFRNVFNAVDSIFIPGALKETTQVSSSDAVLSDSVAQYDRVVSRSYTFESTTITQELSREIAALVASHQAAVRLGSDVLLPVLFTDSSVESSYNIQSANQIKLSFRVSDNLPVSQLPLTITPKANVFNDVFRTQFA